MEELDLYKFIGEQKLEYHWVDEDNDVVLFVEHYKMKNWNTFLKSYSLNIFEDGIESVMKDGYSCFHMKDMCEYFGIKIERIFEKENK